MTLLAAVAVGSDTAVSASASATSDRRIRRANILQDGHQCRECYSSHDGADEKGDKIKVLAPRSHGLSRRNVKSFLTTRQGRQGNYVVVREVRETDRQSERETEP